MPTIDTLNRKVIRCKKCPRLISYIKNISRYKIKRFSNEKYWGKPLPSFGDINAQLFLIGLAPAAHGGNRTGRMFTGDSSGDWVSRVLYENGFATKSTSTYKDDGFVLVNAYITAAVRCAPPQNKPTKEELDNCSTYLKNEFEILKNIKVIICLGKIAFDSYCKIFRVKGVKFAHGKLFMNNNIYVICTYHPSRQNTQTGRLSWIQWCEIFSRAKNLLDQNK